MSMWTEPEKKIPVAYDVDVVVAGAGVSGIYAALAAARCGADTVLIDRFNVPGGIYGPGWRPPGGRRRLQPGKGAFPTNYVGLPLDFVKRLEALGFGEEGSSIYTPKNWMTESMATSYLLLKVLEEAKVKLLLSTWASDPMLEAGTVKGVLVENKSGRIAVKAKVTIDATGEADLARRAGAPIICPKTSYHEMDLHAPTGIGNQYAILGVDSKKFEAYLAEQKIEDPAQLDIGDPNSIKVTPPRWQHDGIAFGMTGRKPDLTPGVDAGDGLHISQLDADFHVSIFEKVEYWKKHFPGFEKAALLALTPFLGARGGPCIEGEYVVTMDDILAGRKFPDNLYVFRFRPPRPPDGERSDGQWTEFPYRCMLPKNLDGLLCTGRSASSIPDTLLRERVMIGHMGQAAGTAAAMAVEQKVAPRKIDVRPLQKALLEAGFYLGEPERLKELGLE